mmetsp:Transcript_76649/g.213053  ORF Transcript_76649/g.213053 Transcript_76649/m.213053 type:complete len:242 (+) Transcript_76649:911-1636(+)
MSATAPNTSSCVQFSPNTWSNVNFRTSPSGSWMVTSDDSSFMDTIGLQPRLSSSGDIGRHRTNALMFSFKSCTNCTTAPLVIPTRWRLWSSGRTAPSQSSRKRGSSRRCMPSVFRSRSRKTCPVSQGNIDRLHNCSPESKHILKSSGSPWSSSPASATVSAAGCCPLETSTAAAASCTTPSKDRSATSVVGSAGGTTSARVPTAALKAQSSWQRPAMRTFSCGAPPRCSSANKKSRGPLRT